MTQKTTSILKKEESLNQALNEVVSGLILGGIKSYKNSKPLIKGKVFLDFETYKPDQNINLFFSVLQEKLISNSKKKLSSQIFMKL